jgi:lipid-binding SYLF domain-containing protein
LGQLGRPALLSLPLARRAAPPPPHNHGSDSSSTFYPDLATCTLASGLLVDASLSTLALRVDGAKTRRAYGAGVTAADVLGGGVAMPAAAAPLARALCEAQGRATAYAFEPSEQASEW